MPSETVTRGVTGDERRKMEGRSQGAPQTDAPRGGYRRRLASLVLGGSVVLVVTVLAAGPLLILSSQGGATPTAVGHEAGAGTAPTHGVAPGVHASSTLANDLKQKCPHWDPFWCGHSPL